MNTTIPDKESFMKQKTLFLFLFLLPLLAGYAFAQQLQTIQGRVLSPDNQGVESARVFLLQVNPTESSDLTPITRTLSDQQGHYQFELTEPTAGKYYRVATKVDGQITSSDLVHFGTGQSTIELDLELPSIEYGLKKLKISKNILAIDPLGDSLMVTDIIYVENNTEGIVDAKSEPLIRELPKQAINFQVVDFPPGSAVFLKEGKVHYYLKLGKGFHQILISYYLPFDQEKIHFKTQLLPSIRELEMIIPEQKFEATFDKLIPEKSKTLKNTGELIYKSQTVLFSEAQDKIGIMVRTKQEPQLQFIIPTVLLALLLIGGFFWYIFTRTSKGDQ